MVVQGVQAAIVKINLMEVSNFMVDLEDLVVVEVDGKLVLTLAAVAVDIVEVKVGGVVERVRPLCARKFNSSCEVHTDI